MDWRELHRMDREAQEQLLKEEPREFALLFIKRTVIPLAALVGGLWYVFG